MDEMNANTAQINLEDLRKVSGGSKLKRGEDICQNPQCRKVYEYKVVNGTVTCPYCNRTIVVHG